MQMKERRTQGNTYKYNRTHCAFNEAFNVTSIPLHIAHAYHPKMCPPSSNGQQIGAGITNPDRAENIKRKNQQTPFMQQRDMAKRAVQLGDRDNAEKTKEKQLDRGL
ncbi:hypothetical protein BJ508DRAFT_113628 [Ascobolus immersus RN42]|uniref:Uncharacterized protein n=1 Tax=Ascobolus immersus RN42 TaxID=1160509 RepID=A0A3N4I7A1_ASCIM|nr:hypothetical protein BJ508DRAFT_113628 [Ascobolus immersus RN42]